MIFKTKWVQFSIPCRPNAPAEAVFLVAKLLRSTGSSEDEKSEPLLLFLLEIVFSFKSLTRIIWSCGNFVLWIMFTINWRDDIWSIQRNDEQWLSVFICGLSTSFFAFTYKYSRNQESNASMKTLRTVTVVLSNKQAVFNNKFDGLVKLLETFPRLLMCRKSWHNILVT